MVSARSDGRRAVYVKNVRALGALFEVSADAFAAVARRHPEAAARIDVEIGYDDEDRDRRLRTAEILIGWEFPHDRLTERAPRLRWIQLMGAGLDHLLPLDWLPRGVRLATAAGAHRDKASEFIAAAVLMLNNRIPEVATSQREGRWEPRFSGVVRGKTALLVGVGGLGNAAAQGLRALGLRLIGVRPSRRPHPLVEAMFAPEHLHDVLPQADFVIVTAPLTAANRGLIGRREFARMKPGAGLVNLGRHTVVDEAAMIEALESGRLGGAVHDLEDPSAVPCDKRLWTTPNLMIMPHCMTNDPATFRDNVLEVFFANLAADLAGTRLATEVDPAREY